MHDPMSTAPVSIQELTCNRPMLILRSYFGSSVASVHISVPLSSASCLSVAMTAKPVPTAKPTEGHRPQIHLKAKCSPKPSSSMDERKDKIDHRRYIRDSLAKCKWQEWDIKEEQTSAASYGIPWDQRGPPGPDQNGPDKWRNQKFRQGSCRWANNGGRDKEKWRLFFQKKHEKLTDADLDFYHPKNANGYWWRELAEKAAAEEERAWQVKQERWESAGTELESEGCAAGSAGSSWE